VSEGFDALPVVGVGEDGTDVNLMETVEIDFQRSHGHLRENKIGPCHNPIVRRLMGYASTVVSAIALVRPRRNVTL
jgi:hypothetical protein